MTPSAWTKLQRNLLYIGITRAVRISGQVATATVATTCQRSIGWADRASDSAEAVRLPILGVGRDHTPLGDWVEGRSKT